MYKGAIKPPSQAGAKNWMILIEGLGLSCGPMANIVESWAVMANIGPAAERWGCTVGVQIG